MLIISFVGDSGTGKTYIITKLTEKLSKKGYKVGCIKHCPHGFDLDHPGKDSHQFKKSGAYGVVVHSPEGIGLVKNICESVELNDLAVEFFMDADFVLAEGFRESKGTKKIELLRKGVCEKPKLVDAVATLSNFDVETKNPLLNPDDIRGIVRFLLKLKEKEEKVIKVKVNQENLVLNPFTKNMIKSTILGLLKSLKKKDKKIKKIDIKMEV